MLVWGEGGGDMKTEDAGDAGDVVGDGLAGQPVLGPGTTSG